MNPIVGILLRLAFIYGFFLLLLRITGKRPIAMGGLGGKDRQSLGTPFDFVVALIISDLPDDVIFGDVPLAQGVVAVGTIMSLHLLVNFLSFKIPQFHRLVSSVPDPIIDKGKLVRSKMQWQRLSESDLKEELRLLRIDDASEVKQAFLEPNGMLSIERFENMKPAKRSDVNGRNGKKR